MDPIFGIRKVLSNRKLGSYYEITIEDEEMSKRAKCGNFLMIGLPGLDPYLLRPFSFLDVNDNSFSILLKVKGKGTELLAELRRGDEVKVLGPIGKSFDPPSEGILIGGGIGIAPLYYQSKWMRGGKLFFGAKNEEEIILVKEFEQRNFKVRTIIEKKGGVVSELVERYLEEISNEEIFICGPEEMIKAVIKVLSKSQLEKTYVYVEERMGCGLGGCKSCVVKTKEGYKQLCIDGPIFPLREIKFD
ncbi:MAG: hypothetical protein ABIN61_05360 [candidate division WOR-3 bacterium]